MSQRFETITPTTKTHYLVGESGVVWFEPDYGPAVILAANNAEDRRNIADFVWGASHLGIAVHGVPANHHITVGMFGGDRLKGFRWLPHDQSGLIVVPPGTTPPVPAIIVMPDTRSHVGRQRITATAVAFHGSTATEEDRQAIIGLIAKYAECDRRTAARHLDAYLAEK